MKSGNDGRADRIVLSLPPIVQRTSCFASVAPLQTSIFNSPVRAEAQHAEPEIWACASDFSWVHESKDISSIVFNRTSSSNLLCVLFDFQVVMYWWIIAPIAVEIYFDFHDLISIDYKFREAIPYVWKKLKVLTINIEVVFNNEVCSQLRFHGCNFIISCVNSSQKSSVFVSIKFDLACGWKIT